MSQTVTNVLSLYILFVYFPGMELALIKNSLEDKKLCDVVNSMARLHLKFLLFILIIIVSCTMIAYVLKCGHPYSNHTDIHELDEHSMLKSKEKSYEDIDCSINGQYLISCKKEGKEIFVPFSFLEKYYEVYGKMAKHRGREQFEWSHSYSKVYKPTTPYNSSGMFMYFSN